MKKGMIQWDYLAYFMLGVLALVVLVLLIMLFKDKMFEGTDAFWRFLGLK